MTWVTAYAGNDHLKCTEGGSYKSGVSGQTLIVTGNE